MLTDEDVRRVATLSRLRLSESEVQRMRQDLGRILEHVESLRQVDTKDVVGTFWSGASGTLRSDEPRPCLTREEALRTAPDHDGTHVRVRAPGETL